MKQRKINLNMIISLVLAVLAVVSLVGYTSSYFTASAKKQGELGFATMSVRFAYYYNGGYHPQNEVYEDVKEQIKLYPADTSAIQRGVAFNVSPEPEGKAITGLAIHNMFGSCRAYVRFWINAYVIKDNQQQERNYGEYFTINTTSDVKLTNAGKGRTQSVYCLAEALETEESSYVYIGATLTMSTTAPDDLMGETLRIDICMDSVQADNGAYLALWDNDSKGYYSGWN